METKIGDIVECSIMDDSMQYGTVLDTFSRQTIDNEYELWYIVEIHGMEWDITELDIYRVFTPKNFKTWLGMDVVVETMVFL